MLTTIIIILILASLLVLVFWGFLLHYETRQRKILVAAINGEIAAHLLQTGNMRYAWTIIYRTKSGEVDSYHVDATNETEAIYNFCIDTAESYLRIKSVKKIKM